MITYATQSLCTAWQILKLKTGEPENTLKLSESGNESAKSNNLIMKVFRVKRSLSTPVEVFRNYENSLRYSKNILPLKILFYQWTKINTSENADKSTFDITIGENNTKDKQIEDFKSFGSRSAITAILTSAFNDYLF